MYLVLLTTILLTSFISGILGMAGGMILMGVMTLFLPVTSAMVLHGLTQLSSNGFRAYLLKEHIKLQVVFPYFLGSITGLGLFLSLDFVPSKALVLILVGTGPFLVMISPKSLQLNILFKRHALACGFLITSAQILGGASGPILDLFFINSPLNRYEVMATKAVTQIMGHLSKIFYYGLILSTSLEHSLEFSVYIIPFVVLTSFLGTRLGKSVLEKLSESQFQKYSKRLIAVIGAVYFLRGVLVL